VTLTIDGEPAEAVLAGGEYDEESDRCLLVFFRVTDGEYPVLDDVQPERLERAFRPACRSADSEGARRWRPGS
jgi:hypothetical protein